jgi:hypothetical protein
LINSILNVGQLKIKEKEILQTAHILEEEQRQKIKS